MGQSFRRWKSRPQTAHPSFEELLFAFLEGLGSSAVLDVTGRFIPVKGTLEDDGTLGIAGDDVDAVEGRVPFTLFCVKCLGTVGFDGVPFKTGVIGDLKLMSDIWERPAAEELDEAAFDTVPFTPFCGVTLSAGFGFGFEGFVEITD